MNIIIQSVNFKASSALENFVRSKVSKLNHCDNIIRADVVLRKTEDGNLKNRFCEIRLIIPGNDHFVNIGSEVYEKSILQAVDTLQKFLRRNKTRLIAKRNINQPFS